ncbi:MAG: hypothetical protein ABI140_06610 [Jatrophihabitantaceae bacterium]
MAQPRIQLTEDDPGRTSTQVILTFSHENFTDLYRVWRAAASADGENAIQRQEDGRGGGKVQVIDWPSQQVLRSVDITLATGFVQQDGLIVVCSYSSLELLDRDLRPVRTITHPLFCNLHSVAVHPAGWVVAASGIDALLLVSFHGEVSVLWDGGTCGYAQLPDGSRRELDLSADHRQAYYRTSEQTTHVNGVEYWPERGSVLATLFHQGQLIEVDGDGNTEVLIDGLTAPHSPRVRADGIVYLADSRSGRIVEYDPDSRSARSIPLSEPCPWLQTVSWLPGERRYLAADSTNGRALMVAPDGTVTEQYTFHQDWRLHEARGLAGPAIPTDA